MKFESIEKLVVGTVYEIKVIEDIPFEINGKEVNVTAEYRGFDKYDGYLMFEVKGAKNVTSYHYQDINGIKKVQG